MFTQNQLERYSRHIMLDAIGKEGQARLAASRVLVVGAGGLGSPLLLYLAASGIGHIGIIDPDRVSLSNLQRQILHETADVGEQKTDSAREALYDLNPEVTVETYPEKLDAENADRLVAEYDIVADGCDDIATRFLLHDICYRQEKTLVSAAIQHFEGQLSTFKAHLGAPHPCYRCLYPEAPPADAMPSCSEAGIFAPLAGMMGAWQAGEVIKELLGIGESLSGSLLRVDMFHPAVRKVALRRDPACKTCGNVMQQAI